jgi:hypothetical protein
MGHYSQLSSLCSNHQEAKPQVCSPHTQHHPQHTSPPATKLLSQLQEVSPWGFLGSVRTPILVATTYGRAPKSRAPVLLLPHASELPVPVVCGKFGSEQCYTATKAYFVEGCLAQYCLVNIKTQHFYLGTSRDPSLYFSVYLQCSFRGLRICVLPTT